MNPFGLNVYHHRLNHEAIGDSLIPWPQQQDDNIDYNVHGENALVHAQLPGQWAAEQPVHHEHAHYPISGSVDSNAQVQSMSIIPPSPYQMSGSRTGHPTYAMTGYLDPGFAPGHGYLTDRFYPSAIPEEHIYNENSANTAYIPVLPTPALQVCNETVPVMHVTTLRPLVPSDKPLGGFATMQQPSYLPTQDIHSDQLYGTADVNIHQREHQFYHQSGIRRQREQQQLAHELLASNGVTFREYPYNHPGIKRSPAVMECKRSNSKNYYKPSGGHPTYYTQPSTIDIHPAPQREKDSCVYSYDSEDSGSSATSLREHDSAPRKRRIEGSHRATTEQEEPVDIMKSIMQAISVTGRITHQLTTLLNNPNYKPTAMRQSLLPKSLRKLLRKFIDESILAQKVRLAI